MSRVDTFVLKEVRSSATGGSVEFTQAPRGSTKGQNPLKKPIATMAYWRTSYGSEFQVMPHLG